MLAVPGMTITAPKDGGDDRAPANGHRVGRAVLDPLAARRVVNCRFIKPLDDVCLARLFPAHGAAVTIEEGTVANGFGAYVRARIGESWPEVRVTSMGLPDGFVEHGERNELLVELGLTAEGIADRARASLGVGLERTLRETA
jgi:1-deoxy-D-xylulose-5-phosphate synthase